MDLIAHSLTPVVYTYGIRSLIGFGTCLQALIHSVLYPRRLPHKASPKAISAKTSYLRV